MLVRIVLWFQPEVRMTKTEDRAAAAPAATGEVTRLLLAWKDLVPSDVAWVDEPVSAGARDHPRWKALRAQR